MGALNPAQAQTHNIDNNGVENAFKQVGDFVYAFASEWFVGCLREVDSEAINQGKPQMLCSSDGIIRSQ